MKYTDFKYGYIYCVIKDPAELTQFSQSEFELNERLRFTGVLANIYDSINLIRFIPIDRDDKVCYIEVPCGAKEPDWAEYFQEIGYG